MRSDNGDPIWVRASVLDRVAKGGDPGGGGDGGGGGGGGASWKRSIPGAGAGTGGCDDEDLASARNGWGWVRGFAIAAGGGAGGQKQKRGTVDLSVTMRDPDYPQHDGRKYSLSAADVKGGTLSANTWWSAPKGGGGAGAGGAVNAPPDDLIQLTHLHEPAVVHCLRERYADGLVYTHTGPILLACNPFRRYEGLYSEATMRKYWEGGMAGGRLPPHVFGVADGAFRAMMRAFDDGETASDQSILVSGESGAGKTVTTKFVMSYLAALSQRYAGAAGGSGGGSGGAAPEGGVEQQVLQSNPILESFGNARTVRNDNSSRFGKFIEIQFQRSGVLVGARIKTYLLETVRMLAQGEGERNFHVFYEILSGQGPDRTALGLDGKSLDEFKIISSSTYDRRDGVQDSETYQDLREAMSTVGFTQDQQLEVLSVPSGLMFCSNMTFVDEGRTDGGCEIDASNTDFEVAQSLLGVTADALNNCLCFASIEARGETLKKTLNPENAAKALEAFMKATYGVLFAYIVERVNDSITLGGSNGGSGAGASQTAFVSVLDIFGFESFESNSFEQLCINYCNEALQQQFNRFVFKLEQEEYEREGIEWSFIEFPDNQEVLDLIEKKRTGILSILDEHCRLARSTDQAFVNQTHEVCADHPRFVKDDFARVRGDFSVHHYAGPVEYSSANFRAKNKDSLPKETTELLLSSSKELLRGLGKLLGSQASASASASDGNRRSSSLKSASVGSKFTTQLKQLRERIDQTAPHYVRCMKPNDALVPDNFVPAIIADQLRCAGVLEAVRVSRVGFPQRYAHQLFVQRYGVLGGRTFNTARRKQSGDLCQILVNAVVPQIWEHQNGPEEKMESAADLISVGLQIGKTKVFLRQPAFETLEKLRSEMLDVAATSIQAAARMFLRRKNYMFILESAVMVQTLYRGHLARKFVSSIRNFYAAAVVQSAWRRYVAWADFNRKLYVVKWVQCTYRGRVARRTYNIMNGKRRAVVTVQKFVRGKIARNELKRLKRDAKNLDHVAQERDALRKEAQRAKQELEELRRAAMSNQPISNGFGATANAAPVSAAPMSSAPNHVAPISVAPQSVAPQSVAASAASSIVYRDFPSNPTAQEEEIRALAEACAAKELEMERLRQELESVREVREEKDTDGPPIKTIIARHKDGNGEDNTANTTMDSSNPVSVDYSSAPMKDSSLDVDTVQHRNYANEIMAYAPKNLDESQDHTDESSLHQVSRKGDSEALMKFIESCDNVNASINEGGYQGKSPLHLAILGGSLDKTSILLRHNAVANLQDASGNTGLHYADNFSMIELLLNEGGANPNIPNVDGLCPLHLAVRRKDLESVKILLAKLADVSVADDIRWYTPLHLIALPDIIANANLSAPSSISVSGKIASLLCKATEPAEPDLNYQDRDGNTPLHHAVVLNTEYAQDLISVLLEHGANSNVINARGQTPLHLLCHNTKLRKVGLAFDNSLKHFLSNGADPNVASLSGSTPLHLCLFHKDIDSAVQLLHAGAQLHMPWRKPPAWQAFWPESGLPDVFSTDMLVNWVDLTEVLSAISTRQDKPPSRPCCMLCRTNFSLFAIRYNCAHCSSLVCKSCSSLNVESSHLPSYCQHHPSPIVCNVCERIILSDSPTVGVEHSVSRSSSIFSRFQDTASSIRFQDTATSILNVVSEKR